MQFSSYTIFTCDFKNISKLSQFDEVNILLAAMIHDMHHPFIYIYLKWN